MVSWRFRCSVALTIAVILLSAPFASLTPFLCVSDHADAHVDLGLGDPVDGISDAPCDSDEGDVTPWNDAASAGHLENSPFAATHSGSPLSVVSLRI